MVKMKARSAFTLIELLVVIAVIAILAALLMPALNRARLEARKAACKANLHNIGLAIATYRETNKSQYPVKFDWSKGESNQWTNAWGRLFYGGHLDNLDVFRCPNRPDLLDLAVNRDGQPMAWKYMPNDRRLLNNWVWTQGKSDTDGVTGDVMNSDYAYDNARIHRNSQPGRAILGDMVEHQWRIYGRASENPQLNGSEDKGWVNYHDLTIDTRMFDIEVEPNHIGGANLVFADHSVQWVETSYPDMWWVPEVQGMTTTTGTTVLEKNPPVPQNAGANTDYVRAGIVQNPRLEEDSFGPPADDDRWGRGYANRTNVGSVKASDMTGQYDHDDVYAVEQETSNYWRVLSPFQFATGFYKLNPDGNAVLNFSDENASILEPDSKTDACLGAYGDYNNGMGWPDTIRTDPGETLEFPYWDEAPY